MDYGFRLYIVDCNVTFDDEFTTDDVIEGAVDIIKADTLPKLLNLLIKGLNDETISDMNWFFLYDENEMTLVSDLPNGLAKLWVAK